MTFSKTVIMFCAASVIAANGLTRRQEEGDFTYIYNEFDYPMVETSNGLEWQNTEEPGLKFTEYPVMDTPGEFKAADGTCLMLGGDSFPVLMMGPCEGQEFTPILETNELRIENPYTGVCEDTENGGFITCDAATAGDICVGDDEGTVSVRPCNGYVARLHNQKFGDDNSASTDTGATEETMQDPMGLTNSFDYYMTWSGSFLEWKGFNSEDVVFTSYPAVGEAGVWRTGDDMCLVIRESNGFPVLEIGQCDFQEFMLSAENTLEIVNPPTNVCGSIESGWEVCPLDDDTNLCVQDDEGYVGVRPCSDYEVKLASPQE